MGGISPGEQINRHQSDPGVAYGKDTVQAGSRAMMADTSGRGGCLLLDGTPMHRLRRPRHEFVADSLDQLPNADTP